MTDSVERELLIEALRRALLDEARYSFHLNNGGGVSRVKDASGRWIERDRIHYLFDPEVVDGLIAKEVTRRALEKAKLAQS